MSAISLMTGEERQDDSVTSTLIRDIHAIFCSPANDGRLKTADLLAELYEIEESPWGDWYGKPLSAHGLSRLLKPYRIQTMPVKAEGKTVRGYKVEQFSDAFAQLALPGVTGVTPEAQSQAGSNARNASNASQRQLGESVRRRLGEDGHAAHLAAQALVEEGIASWESPWHPWNPRLRALCTHDRETFWINQGGRRICPVCHPPVEAA